MTHAPHDLARRQRLAEEEVAEQDRGHRNEQCHQHHVARPRAHQDRKKIT